MNIKKINPCLYVKTLSESEIELRDYIQKEISQVNPSDRATIERIVQEVLSRVKQDITNMNGNFGVISVNGKNGIVTITPESIGAEASFIKRSAFNKNFGSDFNTVCEGNDPRLSDARQPLSHKHEALEIEGLDKMIGFNEKIIELQKHSHSHENQSILNRLQYNGNHDTIELSKLDQLEHYLEVDIESVVAHTGRDDIHVTEMDKASWNAKETPDGAQQKANRTLVEAKSYADRLRNEILGNASVSYQTLGKIEEVIKGFKNGSDASANTLVNHIQDQSVHITRPERELIQTIPNKAEQNHEHDQYLQWEAFVSIDNMP